MLFFRGIGGVGESNPVYFLLISLGPEKKARDDYFQVVTNATTT